MQNISDTGYVSICDLLGFLFLTIQWKNVHAYTNIYVYVYMCVYIWLHIKRESRITVCTEAGYLLWSRPQCCVQWSIQIWRVSVLWHTKAARALCAAFTCFLQSSDRCRGYAIRVCLNGHTWGGLRHLLLQLPRTAHRSLHHSILEPVLVLAVISNLVQYLTCTPLSCIFLWSHRCLILHRITACYYCMSKNGACFSHR